MTFQIHDPPEKVPRSTSAVDAVLGSFHDVFSSFFVTEPEAQAVQKYGGDGLPASGGRGDGADVWHSNKQQSAPPRSVSNASAKPHMPMKNPSYYGGEEHPSTRSFMASTAGPPPTHDRRSFAPPHQTATTATELQRQQHSRPRVSFAPHHAQGPPSVRDYGEGPDEVPSSAAAAAATTHNMSRQHHQPQQRPPVQSREQSVWLPGPPPHGSRAAEAPPGTSSGNHRREAMSGSRSSRSQPAAQHAPRSPVESRHSIPRQDESPSRGPLSIGELLDQHVEYYLHHHPHIRSRHRLERQSPGVYMLDGRPIRVEWQHSRDPANPGYLMAVDGPLRQPFGDYMEMKESNATYTDWGIRNSNLHAVPKENHMTFQDSGDRYSRLEAMKVAKEQAHFREKAAEYAKAGQTVPSDLIEKYQKTIDMKLGKKWSKNARRGGGARSPPPQPAAPPAAPPPAPKPQSPPPPNHAASPPGHQPPPQPKPAAPVPNIFGTPPALLPQTRGLGAGGAGWGFGGGAPATAGRGPANDRSLLPASGYVRPAFSP